jgi:hypothetical protein
MLRTVISAAAAVALLSSQSFARPCTPYERGVHDAAKAVKGFRGSDEFADFGWAIAGPFNRWLKTIQSLQDDSEHARQLLGDYGFVPADIYNVANQYRDKGYLDEFYKDTERAIDSLKCP